MKSMKDKNKNNFTEFLKEKRQSKNISLEKLSEITKIQLYHLEALEAGHFEKLPPSVYRTGIFKRLSKFLGVSENEFMEAYKNEIESSALNSSDPSYINFSFQGSNTPIKNNNSYFILTPNKLIFLGGGLLLVFLSIYIWYQFNFLVGPPNVVIDREEDFITKEDAILINGKTDNGIDLTINGEKMYVASNGSFKKEIQLADGVNNVEIKAVNNFGKTTKIIRQIFKETVISN